jgi:protein-disulfide isomerase
MFMSKTAWIIFTAIVILVLGGLVVYSRSNSTQLDVSSVDANSVLAASEQSGDIGDRVFNNTKSNVVLVKYADFQCPACAAAAESLKPLLEEYGDRISFISRNFPITQNHPNARAAAAAAEAAGQQNKFWEMHYIIYENQRNWGTADGTQRTTLFKSYAEQIGLDMTAFDADIASSSINQKVLFDQALANKVGVNSTPTFIFNGERLPEGAASGILSGDLTELKKLIDAAL